MSIFRILFVLILTSVSLSACAGKMEGERLSVDELVPGDKSQVAEGGIQGGETVNLIANKEGIQTEQLAPEAPKGYSAAVNQLSTSNVQIFPLDGAPVQQEFKGSVQSFKTPNVEIFPLDQAMAESMNLVPKPIELAKRGGEAGDGPLTPMPMNEKTIHQVMADAGKSQPKAQDFVREGSAAVYFDHGSATLDSAADNTIEAVAQNANSAALAVNGYASTTAVITDPIKRKMVNLKLSMDRAFAVARALIDKGVSPDTVRTVGWGEAAPLAGADAEAASRRVEITRVSP